MHYGDRRWIEIEAIDPDRMVVVCPLGSLEQPGYHLPLLTDTHLVSEVANRVEQSLPESVLLTPTLWLGASDHHLDFSGTISVANTLYVEMIKSMVACFTRAGLRRILFLNGHGGNIAPTEVAITEAVNTTNAGDSSHIVLGSYWSVAGPEFAAEKHGMETPAVSHACEYETSMMQVVREDLVHLDQAEVGKPVKDGPFYHSELGGRISVASRFQYLSPTGAMGRPQAATPEKGESLLSAAATQVTALVTDMLSWPAPRLLKH